MSEVRHNAVCTLRVVEPVRIIVGDVLDGLRSLPAGSVHCCVTSPPYWGLRDYGVDGQIGLEGTPDAYVAKMVEVFGEVRRVLRDDGTLWLNLGDSYATTPPGCKGVSNSSGLNGINSVQYRDTLTRGHGQKRNTIVGSLKPKDLCMIPWRVALALQADSWYLRSVIVWAKKSPMPESVTDRPTSSWEPIFLLAKSDRYFYDAEAVKEQGITGAWDAMPPIGGVKHAGSNGNATYSGDRPPSAGTRNQRNVWHLGPEPYREAHFATFPTEIPRRAIKAGTSEKGCCPACGAPWSRVVARTQIKRDRPNDYTKRTGEYGTGNSCANSVAGVEARTIGWLPSCRCDGVEPSPSLGVWSVSPDDEARARSMIDAARGKTTSPCVVLDPFLGSGTTVAVARTLGRHGVGCELNPEYADLARVRIGKAERPHTFADQSKILDGGTLFAASEGAKA